ncbi:acetyltransferase [Bradyrhizobium sp. AUGA SZCCT0158]|uniref:acetyltransferase n=1 Tax=Bradyrhizobium sp. AUGA SZCCT0158 TaxID=2807661 RepID=UPI001BA50F0A|nr:acetyltransferase [Bradyrhizobium sp. AUGA SZCCT0158]MBR1199503.1 acetyltransferase [Bradyrhizobium sp. AUGA SZCCT0158]
MQNLIIFGASGHARVIADAARRSASFNVLGFVDQDRAAGEVVDGVTVLGSETGLQNILSRSANIMGIIGVGDNQARARIAASMKTKFPELQFANVIHPSAVIADDIRFGQGVFVAASATINCGSRLGDHVVINTRASVDHDCVIEDYGFVGPGVSLAGGVSIGRGSFIGTGAAVIPSIQIGNDAVIGAGSAVIRPVASGATVAGVPARALARAKPAKK